MRPGESAHPAAILGPLCGLCGARGLPVPPRRSAVGRSGGGTAPERSGEGITPCLRGGDHGLVRRRRCPPCEVCKGAAATPPERGGRVPYTCPSGTPVASSSPLSSALNESACPSCELAHRGCEFHRLFQQTAGLRDTEGSPTGWWLVPHRALSGTAPGPGRGRLPVRADRSPAGARPAPPAPRPASTCAKRLIPNNTVRRRARGRRFDSGGLIFFAPVK